MLPASSVQETPNIVLCYSIRELIPASKAKIQCCGLGLLIRLLIGASNYLHLLASISSRCKIEEFKLEVLLFDHLA